ncbi:UBX domain-containing protein 7-like isoform X2 [Ruditapes philippinarum]|uniref:UBX domain-containing protein 7-like isoform X2 n=1 Tax=Ruditapes philippinarum TaxID=129788 RepID=UPI00295AE1B3|nr:UBX domain-containing protein 7-like isoform X2 [Ruditapes philippinarum]
MDKTGNTSESVLAQFCSVTGADAAMGRQLLEACGGNLELAINMHMEGGGSGAGASNAVDEVRAPIPQIQETLVDDAPVYGTFRGRKRKTRSVFDGFRDFQEEAPTGRGRRKSQQEEELMAGASGSRSSRKTKTLQDLFRPPIDITYKGNLANARETGKTQGKWLMVNIQNVQEFPCQALNRDVWSNSAVKALIKDNFIFWQVYHDSVEGQKYRQFYKVDSWPYVAILDPQTGENMITWSKIEPLTFCDLVSEFLTQNPATNTLSPDPPAAKREDSVIDASEDDQLQAAIKASLTEKSKDISAKPMEFNNDSESDASDLETFTDSEDESQHSSVKTRKRSNSGSKSASHGKSSPTRKHSPNRNSGDEQSSKSNSRSSPVRRSVRCNSPLAGSSSTFETQRPQRKCSPQRTRKRSPCVESISSPRKTSPLRRKLSPSKTSSPLKSESIHNDVHPAVLENIRTNSMSEDCSAKEETPVKESASESSETESDKSMDIATDHRDYRSFLGPETDEKTTLMLRLPDGQRERLCISFSSKLLALVLFVGSKGFSNERFELIAQFPRRQLSQLDYEASLRDIGLHAQETIFVQARS